MSMEKQSTKPHDAFDIKKNGMQGTINFLSHCPIDRNKWAKHVRKQIEQKVDDFDEIPDDKVIAEATIEQVSYTNIETGECDIRWEARYEIVVKL